MEPPLVNHALESTYTITTTTTMNTSTAAFPAAPSKNVTFAVNYELPMVDQFMKVERKRRSSTHSTVEVSGSTSSTTMAHNTNIGAIESNNNPDENENDPEQQQQQHQQQPQQQSHPTRSPPGRRVSARDKQKRNTPVTRTRVKYDLQLVPVVRRNQAFLDYFAFSWTKKKPAASNASSATRRSNRLLGPSNENSCAQSSDVCQCQPVFPFLEDSSVLWTPAHRSEWEDTVSEMTAVCTQAALRRHTDRTKTFVPPLSRDYIRDRIDIDDPLRGYQLRHKYGGWLQGFVLYTNFTTWTHGFHWDSLHPKSGFPTDGLDHPNMDMDGSLAAELEAEPRAGDPRGGGIVFSSLAEIGLLGGLGCGEYLLRMALTDIWKNTKYKYVVLQGTEQSKAFYERFGFVRVGAICQYGKSEKPKVAGRRGRRRGSMATQRTTSSTVEVVPPVDDVSNAKDRKEELPAATTAITAFPDDSRSDSQSAALDGDAKLPLLSEELNEQPVAADATDIRLEMQLDNEPAASNNVTFTEALEDAKPAVASGRRSVTFEMDLESIGDDSWDPLASEPSEPASTNSYGGESAEEVAADDSEMHSSALEIEYAREPADSATTAEEVSGEHLVENVSKAPPSTVDSPPLPAVAMHVPSGTVMNDKPVSAENSAKSSVVLSDVAEQPVEEKKDDDVRSSGMFIDNVAASREPEEETNEQDGSPLSEISSLKRQPAEVDREELQPEHATTAADTKAQSSATIAEDQSDEPQHPARLTVLAVDAGTEKTSASSESREAHTSEKQENLPSLPIEETQQEYLLRGMSPRRPDEQGETEGVLSNAVSAPQSIATATPLPPLAAYPLLPPIDFTNMPVVGYRHWTHANESERSLQKHGGPSYMMCLKLPERTSESSDEDFGSCLQCGASRLKSNHVSLTDQMLAMLGVERKPRIENLGATSTPGARRSVSMPLDFPLSADCGEASPLVSKTLGRRGSDSNPAISISATTTSTSARPKNSATAFLSATNSLSQNRAVRVAKMPKRSHSMAEIEGPPRKRPRVEELELEIKPPAKKPTPKADGTDSGTKKSSSKARERARAAKSATEARPPPPQNGQPLSYAQKQYHSVWLAVPPENPATVASPSPQRAHPLERAALAAIAATKSPARERRPSAPSTTAQPTTATTTKRKVGRPPKIGRPIKKSSTAKSFRSATAKSTKTKAKKSSKPPKTTSTADTGRIFHSIRGPDGKFVTVEVKKVGRPPKAKVGRPPKDKSKTKTTSSTPKRKVSEVRKASSPKKKKSKTPTPAAATPKDHRSLFAIIKPGKPRTIDPKTFRKQKVVAFPKEKHHFYNKVVMRKRSNAEKFYYVVEYDDEKNLLCIVPMYAMGTLSGQREGRPRYRCDIGETDANFKIVSGSDYAVVRSCAIMKTSVVALEAWDIETEDDENFVTRTS